MPSRLDSAEYEVFARTQGVVIGENMLRIEPAIDQRLRAEGQSRPQRERGAHPAAKAIEGTNISWGRTPCRFESGGSKSWIQRLTIKGKRRDLGLGGYPLVTLAEAREAAYANRGLARRGGDPLAEKRRVAVPTVAEAAEATIQAHRKRWRSPVTERHWRQALQRYARAVFGDEPVTEIGREDVLRVLTPIWTDKPEEARKLRRRIRAILQWAQAHGFVEHNAAGEAIEGALPRQPAVRAHLRSLPYKGIPAALETISAASAARAVKLCLRFVILTVVRSREARRATWAEIERAERVWRIPAERMKAGAEHRVPLAEAVLDVLAEAEKLRDGSEWVFPSPVRVRMPLSNMVLTKLLRDTGLAQRATVHAFRSSFRDWCAETGQPRELAESALAHAVAGVEGAYFRSDLFDRRRRVMEGWSRYVTKDRATVVHLHG